MKDMMGQAKQMQEEMEAKLSSTVVEASTGGGLVTAKMNGRKELLRLTIDPAALTATTPSDIEMLEDLITAAINQAGRKADEVMQSNMSGLLGSLNLPGI